LLTAARSGEDLRGLEASCRTYATLLNRFGQEISSLYLAVVHQAVLNFRGQAQDPLVLDGTAFSAASLQLMEERPLELHLFVHAFFSIKLAVFFGDLPRARKMLDRGRRYIKGVRRQRLSVLAAQSRSGRRYPIRGRLLPLRGRPATRRLRQYDVGAA
jgi:hypothetical protein